MAEDWKLQVSYKTSFGDLINIRANTADELSVLQNGPNVGGTILQNGIYNVPILVRFTC
jgi:hypothetical protein